MLSQSLFDNGPKSLGIQPYIPSNDNYHSVSNAHWGMTWCHGNETITPKRHRSTKRLLSMVSQRREEREKCEGRKGKQNGKGGKDEKRVLRSRWTLVRPVPLLQGGFLLPKFTSLPPQVKKSLSTPVQHGLIRIFSRCSQYRSG